MMNISPRPRTAGDYRGVNRIDEIREIGVMCYLTASKEEVDEIARNFDQKGRISEQNQRVKKNEIKQSQKRSPDHSITPISTSRTFPSAGS